MKRISSRQNSVVTAFRSVARGETPDLLLLDGPHLVAEAMAAGYRLQHLLVAHDRSTDAEIAALATRAAAHADVSLGSASVMAAVSPVRSPSAVVAIAHRPTARPRMFTSPSPFVVVACDVQDPGNLGAMIRVAEAAGTSGMVTTGKSANPFGWKALRGSMGSALRFPIAALPTAEEAVAEARRHGCRILATVPRGGSSIYETNLTGAVAMLVGGEGSGLSNAVIAAADLRVSIPMQPPVESLNAATAVALLVYEARRQRA